MIINPLFTDTYNTFISDLPEKFKERCLFYQIKENQTLLVKIKNDELKSFIQNKTKNNNFNNIIKFYEGYYENKININWLFIFFVKIISDNLSKIFEKWYIEKQDYEEFLKKNDFKEEIENLKKSFKELEKEDLKYYKKLSNNSIEFLKKIEIFEKIISWDFQFLKEYLFLDYLWENDKIVVNIEIVFYLFQLIDINIIKEENQFYYLYWYELYTIFTETWNSIFTEIIKWITNLFQSSLWKKFLKSDIFYLTIFNKIKLNKLDHEKIKNSYENLKWKYITKRIWNIYDVLSHDLYGTTDFLYLWMMNIILLIWVDEIMIPKDIIDELLEKWNKKDLKIYEEKTVSWFKKISKNISELYWEDYKIKTVSCFFETWNINKKNITYKQKEISDYKSISKIIDLWIQEVLKELINFNKNIENFQILLEPLTLASKKLIVSNLYRWNEFNISDNFLKIWNKFNDKYLDKYINIDFFIIEFLEEDIETYILINNIKSFIIQDIWRKIPENEKKYILSENQLFKRILVYLAKLWYIDLYGNIENKQIEYYSWDWYWWGYWASSKYENISIFEPQYIKFKKVILKKEIPEKNYISWNELYISLLTKKDILKELSKFCILKKLESYMILEIWRDILIKAKNTYDIKSKDIFDIFKKLDLELPKNLDILINSIDNQKIDLNIFPIWIPVICENNWMFSEFLKLKMFSDYIIYSDEERKLIIFSYNFAKTLETLLNKRKVLFNKKLKNEDEDYWDDEEYDN